MEVTARHIISIISNKSENNDSSEKKSEKPSNDSSENKSEKPLNDSSKNKEVNDLLKNKDVSTEIHYQSSLKSLYSYL